MRATAPGLSLLVLSLALLGTGPAGSLPAPAAPSDTPRERLERALAALGGRERIGSADSWCVEGEGRENLTAELQGLSPGRPTWRPHRERLAVDLRTLRVAWERRTPRNDQSLRWRRFVYGPDSSGFFDWNAGRGHLSANATAEARRRALARRIPHLLLLELAARARELSWSGVRQVDGGWVDELEARLPGDVTLLLGFPRTAPQVSSVSYAVTLPGAGRARVEWRWRDWKKGSVGLVPGGHTVLVDGVTYQEVSYTAYGARPDLAAELLRIPADRPAESSHAPETLARTASGIPAEGEVAPGIHVLEFGGFGVMVAEFRDFLVAMEAPEHHPGLEAIPAARDTASVTAEFLAAIRARWPTRPVRYLVVSHHHSDHLGGAATFARAGATLLVSRGHEAAARRAIGPDQAAAAIEVVTAKRSIGDGSHTLEVIPLGHNPHTDEALFAWFPQARVVFQGDLFYFDDGAPFPPAGRETMNRYFARWLRDHGHTPRAIFGVHGHGAAGEEHWRAMLPRSVGSPARSSVMSPR